AGPTGSALVQVTGKGTNLATPDPSLMLPVTVQLLIRAAPRRSAGRHATRRPGRTTTRGSRRAGRERRQPIYPDDGAAAHARRRELLEQLALPEEGPVELRLGGVPIGLGQVAVVHGVAR